MNYKKRNFLITNSIIIIFVLLLSLFANYHLILIFGFNNQTFIFITIAVMLFGLLLYLFLSKSIFEILFKSDENLKKAVKETLHELNIPISTIQLNTQMLEKRIVDEKSLNRLKRIKLASKELLKLYESMEYQIKKEIDKIDIIEFDVKVLIENCLSKVDDIKRDIEIITNIDETIIKSDINGFEKILDNLFSNALKYNLESNGKIEINLKENILSVFNTGKEIDTKNLFFIFDKYFQEDKSKNGFGLGLSIVKDFCDKNKIPIKIFPKKNGNTFVLNLSNLVKK